MDRIDESIDRLIMAITVFGAVTIQGLPARKFVKASNTVS